MLFGVEAWGERGRPGPGLQRDAGAGAQGFKKEADDNSSILCPAFRSSKIQSTTDTAIGHPLAPTHQDTFGNAHRQRGDPMAIPRKACPMAYPP
jgi:hypothetical protein